jgi:hypothetical protein
VLARLLRVAYDAKIEKIAMALASAVVLAVVPLFLLSPLSRCKASGEKANLAEGFLTARVTRMP